MRGKTILADPLDETWASQIDRTKEKRSMFLGTWSFTEADLGTRELVREKINAFGYIWLVFWSDFESTNNADYLLKWIDRYLDASHNVLSWEMPKHNSGIEHLPSYVFVAVRKDVGNITCTLEAGCHRRCHRKCWVSPSGCHRLDFTFDAACHSKTNAYERRSAKEDL